MKKIILLSSLFLMLFFQSFGQKGAPTWKVNNIGNFSNCSYTVCLQIAVREISTQTVASSEWVCHTIAPGASAGFSQVSPILPAPGYEIVVIGATATYNTTTFTNMSLTIWTNDVRSGSCSGGSSSNWVTMWQRTGTYSFNIGESVIVG